MTAVLSGTLFAVVFWAWVAPKELGRWAALAHKSYRKHMEDAPDA